jgi:hypothetical protein
MSFQTKAKIAAAAAALAYGQTKLGIYAGTKAVKVLGNSDNVNFGGRNFGIQMSKSSKMRRPYKRSGKKLSTAQKVKILYKDLKATEPKYIKQSAYVGTDLVVPITPKIGGAGAVLMNGMVRGTTVQTRIGDEVKFNRIQLNVHLQNISASSAHIRFMLVLCKNVKGAAPLIAQDTATSAAGIGYLFECVTASTVWPWQQYNYNSTDVADSFTILHDEDIILGTSIDSSAMLIIDKPVWFSTSYKRGNAGDITDIEDNALYMLVFGNDGTNNKMRMDGALYFVDK